MDHTYEEHEKAVRVQQAKEVIHCYIGTDRAID